MIPGIIILNPLKRTHWGKKIWRVKLRRVCPLVPCDPGRSWRASHAPMFGIDPDTLVAHYWSPACARAPVAVIQCVLHAIEWVIECVFISHHRVSHPHLAARRPHAQAPVAAGSLAAKLTWECVRVCAARTDGSGECGVFCSRGFGGSCCMV